MRNIFHSQKDFLQLFYIKYDVLNVICVIIVKPWFRIQEIKEPQQLTKFTWWVHLNKVSQRTFHFKDVIAIFLGLHADTVALFAKEARFFQI